MTVKDPKSDLREYLQAARDALVWKLDGLSEYRPSAAELTWSEDDPMTDMFAFPEESRADIIGLYKKA